MSMQDSQRLQLLLEAGRLLSSKLELPELLRTVLELAARVVNAERSSLMLLDERSQELYFDVALGLGEEAAKLRLKPGQGIAGTVAQTRKPEIINDARKDPRWSPKVDESSGFTTRSILAVPILLKGKLVGVVEAINKTGGAGFDMDDLEMFESFASQAGVAIDNARLFASLREEKFKLATIFSQMKDGVVLAEADGRVLMANDAASKLLGGGSVLDLAAAVKGMEITPSFAEIFSVKNPLLAFNAVRREPTLLAVAGQAMWVPLEGRDGRLFVFRDDTESFRQEGLKRSFLSLISHKLKTPLAAVIGFSDILLNELRQGAAVTPMSMKAAKTVNEQGAKVGELVDKLLRYTMLESPDAKPQIEPVIIDEAVHDALKSLRDHLAARDAKISYKANGVTVPADRSMLIESVKNLVENAVKFDAKPSPTVAVSVEGAGEWAAVSVTDMGPGIPPEEQQAVFSRFHQVEKDFTGQKEGMGLGLAYVKKVAELHGGSVKLSSRLGQGTTVTITLPRRRSA